ncbi:hypothetical protein [Shewanella sp. MM_2022_3]|nr:hypothetical protein [Shewanella sp. MM_2022_3]
MIKEIDADVAVTDDEWIQYVLDGPLFLELLVDNSELLQKILE